MSRGWSNVIAYPTKVMEIPYPWESYKRIERMPVWQALNDWILKYIAPSLQLVKPGETNPLVAWDELERNGIKLCGFEHDYDEIYRRLNSPCEEADMEQFLSELIDDLTVYSGTGIRLVEPKWVTRSVEYQNGSELESWWEAYVDQQAWVRDHVPPPYLVGGVFGHNCTPVSINREQSMMLLTCDTGLIAPAQKVSLDQVWVDYVNLKLDIPVHWLDALQRDEELGERLRKRAPNYILALISLKTSEDEESLMQLHEESNAARKRVQELSEDHSIDQCTNRDKQKIINFVESYGFPFIPFEPDVAKIYGECYFVEFKRYYRQFMIILERMERGKRSDLDDYLNLGRLISNPSFSELDVKTTKNPESDTVTNFFVEKTICSFVLLVRILSQANKQLRDRGLGQLLEFFVSCRYCGRTTRKHPLTKYPRFTHCSDSTCRDRARKDRKQWRLENEPGYKERQQQLYRKRQAKRRARLKKT